MSSKGKDKKGGKKKGKDSKAVKGLTEGDEYDRMDVEQLTEELKKNHGIIHQLRRDRNYYQCERDQIQQYLDICNEDIRKTEAHIKNIDAQMERLQDTHRNDIRIYLQKVIHLEYEHSNNIEAVDTLASQTRETEMTDHQAMKEEMKATRTHLKNEYKKEEYANEDEIKRLKEVERKEMSKLREQFERNHQDLQQSYENRLQQLKDDLELRRKMEIHEIEERKNRHINDLMINHDKNFTEMKNYYNSITQDNLDLIKELNNEIEDLKVAHLQNEKAMEQIEKKNETLSEPLAQAEMRVKALRHKLTNYQKDKVSLKHAKARLNVLEETYKSMIADHSRILEQYASVSSERDRLYTTFEETVLNVQNRSNERNLRLEKMLDEYKDLFEVKKAQFTSVLRASNLDPLVLQNVTKKLDDVLSAKNEQIHELTYETAKLQKAHNDLVHVYEAKLSKLGIPRDHLHLEPILGDTITCPADLIVQ